MKVNKKIKKPTIKKHFITMKMKDLLVDGDKDVKYDDRAFRRGYHHGYSDAIDATKAGKNVIKFFNTTLFKWRFGKKPFKYIFEYDPPPRCKG